MVDGDSPGEPSVSVVVPAKNAASSIGALLSALRNQAGDDALQIIVADDTSSDATTAIARSFAGVEVVAALPPGGSYAARNAGASLATAPVIAFVDADCVPCGDWLINGLNCIRNAEDGVLAGAILPKLPARPSGSELLDMATAYDQGRFVDEGHVAAGNFWVRRSVIEAHGLFDSRIRFGGDTEYGNRLTKAGVRMAFCSTAAVRHPVLTWRPMARRSFRRGFGAGLAGRPLYISQVARRVQKGSYAPGDLFARTFLEHYGHRPARRLLLRVAIAKTLVVRVPLIAGNLAGALRRTTSRRHGA